MHAVTAITGALTSLVKVIVCVAVSVLPQASVTVHVLVIGTLYNRCLLYSAPSVKVAVRPVEQLSVTLAVPKAALIWLQLDYMLVGEGVTAITGALYLL